MIGYNTQENIYFKQRRTTYSWIKLGIYVATVTSIPLNGFYSILFNRTTILTTMSTLIFSIGISVVALCSLPILTRRDDFMSLLNGRKKFELQNFRGSLLGELTVVNDLTSMVDYRKIHYFVTRMLY